MRRSVAVRRVVLGRTRSPPVTQPIRDDEPVEDQWSGVDGLLLRALAAENFDRTRLAELAADSSGDLRDVVLTVCAAFPGWRLGQTWANVVRVLHPDLYEEMTGTNIDPFYRDDRVDAFRAWLMTRARTTD